MVNTPPITPLTPALRAGTDLPTRLQSNSIFFAAYKQNDYLAIRAPNHAFTRHLLNQVITAIDAGNFKCFFASRVAVAQFMRNEVLGQCCSGHYLEGGLDSLYAFEDLLINCGGQTIADFYYKRVPTEADRSRAREAMRRLNIIEDMIFYDPALQSVVRQLVGKEKI